MALFVLGDPHLSLGASKPMDIFPAGTIMWSVWKKLAEAHPAGGRHRAGG